jgi:hypothetical protein
MLTYFVEERGEGNCGAVRHEGEVLRGVSEQVA